MYFDVVGLAEKMRDTPYNSFCRRETRGRVPLLGNIGHSLGPRRRRGGPGQGYFYVGKQLT